MRVGLGFDAHAFDPDRPLILGGVAIPDSAGLTGHSDADVLSHAVADALLGAAGLGDLGTHFPADNTWKDAASTEILKSTMGMLREQRWSISNVDATLIAQAPHLAPHRDAMRDNLARVLEIEPDLVSIKATSTDGMGTIGRAEGIAALAVASITRD